MVDVSQSKIEAIAKTVESEPTDVTDDELMVLLDGVAHPDHHMSAGDALKDLVNELSEEELVSRFDTANLSGRLTTESVSGGTALGTVLSTLAEDDPDVIRELREEIHAGLGKWLDESPTTSALEKALDVETELVAEAETMLSAENSTARNVGVRIIGDVISGSRRTDSRPEAVEDVIPEVWELLKAGRSTRKPRENAVETLQAYAEVYPDKFVGRVDELKQLLRTTPPSVRNDILELLGTIANEDPGAVEPAAETIRLEFDDIYSWDLTEREAMETIAQIAPEYPDAARPLDPIVEYLETNERDEAAIRVLAEAGGIDHFDLIMTESELYGVTEFDTAWPIRLLNRLDEPERQQGLEQLRELCSHDRPTIRYRALSTVKDGFEDEIESVKSLYVDRLGDLGMSESENVVGNTAAEGLLSLSKQDPEQLTATGEQLFEELVALWTNEQDGAHRVFDTLGSTVAQIARADTDLYSQIVNELEADDTARQNAALKVFRSAAFWCPDELADPVPVLLELYGDEYETNPTAILADLTYSRPGAVEPAIERAVNNFERMYQDDKSFDYYYPGVFADIATAHPDELVDITDKMAEDYIEVYSGDYPYDNENLAVALSFIAQNHPERVRQAVEPLLERDREDRPPSFPLVMIALGETESVPEGWASDDENGLGAIDTQDFREQLRIVKLLETLEYQPAVGLLEQIAAEPAAEEVEDAARKALQRVR